MVWGAGARLKSLQEGQGFEVIPMELEKACPEVAGIHLVLFSSSDFFMPSKTCFYWLQKLLCIVPKIKDSSTAFVSFLAASTGLIKIRINFLNGWLYKGRICVPVSACWGTTPNPNDKEFGEGLLYLHTPWLFCVCFLIFKCWGQEGKRFCVIFSPSRQALSKFQLSFITSKMNHWPD